MATTNLLHPLTLLALATVLLAGCAQLGPRALSEGRPLYNVAVQRTEAEQLLLNIVRQRYSDPVLFLDVTSSASGFSGQANVGWSSRVFESVTESASAVLGGSLRENPNIFYAPNTGEKFVRQMLTPLSIEKLALVLQAGWSIERVLLMSGESMNKLRNTPQSRVSDAGTPRYRAASSHCAICSGTENSSSAHSARKVYSPSPPSDRRRAPAQRGSRTPRDLL